MGAGVPSGLIGSALVLGLLGFTWWAGGVLDAAEDALFGDVPEDAKAATRKSLRGGGCEQRPSISDVIARRHGEAE